MSEHVLDAFSYFESVKTAWDRSGMKGLRNFDNSKYERVLNQLVAVDFILSETIVK